MTIYYTIDGNVPTAASTPYTVPFTVSSSQRVRAVQIETDKISSLLADVIIALPGTVGDPPVFDDTTLAVIQTTFNRIKLTIPVGTSVIFSPVRYAVYMRLGSAPTLTTTYLVCEFDTEEVYLLEDADGNPITTGTWYFKVVCLDTTNQSTGGVTVKSVNYSILTDAPVPSITVESGKFNYTATITMATTLAGATIRYTTDGSTPDATSNLYVDEFEISVTTTIKAITIKTGYNNSEVYVNTVTLDVEPPQPALLSNDDELLKSVLTLFTEDSTILSYVSTRIRQDGNFVPGEIMPSITVSVMMDKSTFGLPSMTGTLKVSVWNSTKKSENMKISRLIGARVNQMIDDTEGKGKINDEGRIKHYYPKLRMIERQNGFFMPTDIDNITRYVQNYDFVVGK